MHAWYPQWPEEDTGPLGTEVINSCEPPHGCWESNPDPLHQQPALLPNVSTIIYEKVLKNSPQNWAVVAPL